MLSGYIKSTVILLLIVANSTMAQENGMHRVPKITCFLNLNHSFPICNPNKDAQAVYPHNLLNTHSEFPSGFNTGVSMFFFKRLGFDLAISIYDFGSDSAKILSKIKKVFPASQSDIFILYNFHLATLSTGFSYRMEYKGFALQPKLLIGYGFISAPQYFDIYLSQENNPTQTYEYRGKTTEAVVFTPSMNLSYAFRFGRHVSMGLQLTCDYVYSRPEFKYSVKSYDYASKTLYESEKRVKSDFESWSIQGGIFFRFVHPD